MFLFSKGNFLFSKLVLYSNILLLGTFCSEAYTWAKAFLFSKTGFCSAAFSFVQQNFAFCSAKLIFVQQSSFCSANWFLFSKLFSKNLLGLFFVQQNIALLRFLFSKEQIFVQQIWVLFSKNMVCSARICCLFSKTAFCSAKYILFSKLVFVQQVVQQIFARVPFLFSKILLCYGFCSANGKFLFSKFEFCSAINEFVQQYFVVCSANPEVVQQRFFVQQYFV